MKTIKRLSVLFVVLAMVFNLVAVNADFSADNTLNATVKLVDKNGVEITDGASVKGGSQVTVQVYLEGATYDQLKVQCTVGEGITLPESKDDVNCTLDILAALVTKIKNTVTNSMGIQIMSEVTVSEGQKIFEFPLTLPTEENSNLTVAYVTAGQIGATIGGSAVAADAKSDSNTATVAITPSWEIAAHTAVTKDVAFDTEETSIGLPDKVTVWNNAEMNDKSVDVAVGTWTCTTEGGYNATKPGSYTFEADLKPTEEQVAYVGTDEADLKKATATVTVGKAALTVDMVKAVKAYDIPQTDEQATMTGEAIAIAVNGLADRTATVIDYAKTWAEDGALVEDVTVTWADAAGNQSLDTSVLTSTTAENKVTLTGTITLGSETIYDLNGVSLTMEVTVTPATVEGATLKNNNKSINAVPSVTITVPASAVEEDTPATDTTEAVGNNTVEVTITADGLDTPIVITKSGVKKSELVDENGASIAYTITGEESYRSLGLTSATDIVITATLNGAALAGTPAEDGSEAPVLSETDTVKQPVSSGGPSYISPSGSSSNGNDQTGSTGSTGSTDTTTPDDTDKPVVDTPVVEAPFDDVAGDHWAAEAIATLKDAGIVGGVTATTFAPDADITRAEFTKMVVGLLKLEAASTEVAFEDCGAEDWYTPYVAAAVEAGLVTGVSETEFAPNSTITREQAFAIIGRAVIDAEANTTLAYTDAAEISEYAVPYVTILTQMGIVEGFGEGTVRPQANITRAEAAKVIAGLMANVVTEEEVAEDNAEEATEEVAEEAKEDAAKETTEE